MTPNGQRISGERKAEGERALSWDTEIISPFEDSIRTASQSWI
jgi:hypothetical protein